jgi:signal peptide peptidase SppA
MRPRRKEQRMKSNSGLLARLFGRTQSPVVTALYANAIGQPLCVHPQIGEQLIGGYLHGAVDARPPTLQIGELAPAATDPVTGVVTEARNVAVLNVSGGLVNRFEPGECDPGPLSYEALRGAFDRALADPTVEAIVMRIESPGGMASGLFDLADYVHASRGAKPIYAAVDDYAYSAAYGLAAAADQIWITRTGGVGSVGVIAYHVDQSGYDSKIGVKVTTVFSGDHKADMNPHEPLSKGTKAWLQQRMDDMRQLFAQSVATYRGLELDAVLATEAQVYQGQAGIDVGFADRLGTYGELLAYIAAGGDEVQKGFKKGDRVRILEPHDEAHQFGTVDIVSAETPYGVMIDGMEDMGVHKWYVDSEMEPSDEQESSDGSVKKKDKPMKMGAADADTATSITVQMSGQMDAETIAKTVKAELQARQEVLAANAEPPAAVVEPVDFTAAITAAPLPASVGMALLKRGPLGQTPAEAIAYAQAVHDACAAAGIDTASADYIIQNTDLATVRAQLIAAKADAGPEIVTAIPAGKTGGAAASGVWGEVVKQFGGK